VFQNGVQECGVIMDVVGGICFSGYINAYWISRR